MVTRKEQRKEKRLKVKQNRNKNFLRQNQKRKRKDDEGEEKNQRRNDSSNKKPKKQSNKKERKPVFLRHSCPEDEEIEYLEKKLGIGSDANKKTANWSRLEKELELDGFAKGLTKFIRDLDTKKGVKFPDEDDEQEYELEHENENGYSLSEEDDDQPEEGGIQDEEEDDYGEEEDDYGEEEEVEEEEEIDGESDEDEDGASSSNIKKQNISFLPKEDLYGKQSAERQKDVEKEDEGKKRSPFFQRRANDQSMRIRRLVNGLVNRLTENNIQPVSSEILALFRDYPRDLLTNSICDVIIQGIANEVVVLSTLGTCFAALVAALTINLGVEFGSSVLEKTVYKFEQWYKEDRDGIIQDGDVVVVSKRSSNLALFIAHLFTFKVVKSRFVFDLLMLLAEEEHLNEASIEIVILVLNECGHLLRKEDPERFVELVKLLQSRQNEANEDEVSNRMEFMLESVYALKNNKSRTIVDAVEHRTKRLGKFLRQLANSSGSTFSPFQITWEDLKHAETRGRWWIVGGVWKDQDEALKRNKEAYAMKQDEILKGGGGPLQQALNRATPKLLKLAKKQRFNTDIRKAIFFDIITAEDAHDAFDRLNSLNLNERQQREIILVLFRCCAVSKTYNEFFAQLATQLCTSRDQHKFTFQLAFWDYFKELPNEHKPQKIANLARLLSHLVLQSCLSLTVIKPVDFTQLSIPTEAFLQTFFKTFLSHGGNTKEGARRVAQALNRIGASKDFALVSDAIQLFLHKNFIISVENENDDNESTQSSDDEDQQEMAQLLTKRVKIVNRILDALQIAHAAADRNQAASDDPFAGSGGFGDDDDDLPPLDTEDMHIINNYT